MKIISFLGYSGTGKTTALTCLSKAIVDSGLGRVGTLKHVHQVDFTLDREGKDTWLHSRAGASLVATISPNELTITRREPNADRNIDLEELVRIFSSQPKPIDFLLVEGLHKVIAHRRNVSKIVCSRNETEAKKLIELHGRRRLLFVTGRIAQKPSKSARFLDTGVPILSLPRDTAEALKIISDSS